MLYLIGLSLIEIIFLIFAQRRNISYLIIFILTNIILSVNSVGTLININQHYLSAESIFGANIFVAHALLSQKSNLTMKVKDLQAVFSAYCMKIFYALLIMFTSTTLLCGFDEQHGSTEFIRTNLIAFTAVYISFYLTHLIYIAIIESTKLNIFPIKYLLAGLGYVFASTIIISVSFFQLPYTYNMVINGALAKFILVFCGLPILLSTERKLNFV